MRPEGEYEYEGCDRSAEEQPRAESSPSGVRLVCERTDDRVVDGIPESGDEHQGCHSTHTDAENVGVKDHEEVAHEHPRKVATDIAHTVCDFADEGNFAMRVILTSCSISF